MIPRDVALEVQFNEVLPRHTDYDFLLRLEETGVPFLMVKEPLVIIHWEDLHLTSRGQSPEKSIAFLNRYKHYLSPRAVTGFCLRQIIYRQLRTGNRLQAWHYLYQYTSYKHMTLLNIVNLVSLCLFRDERISKYLAHFKKRFCAPS